MTEVEELRPVPRERAILESFFTQLGMFSFDRAKDYVEKEKDSSKSAGAIWAALLAALAHLAAAEKAYHNMTFLGQKMGNDIYVIYFTGGGRHMKGGCVISNSVCFSIGNIQLPTCEGWWKVQLKQNMENH